MERTMRTFYCLLSCLGAGVVAAIVGVFLLGLQPPITYIFVSAVTIWNAATLQLLRR